MSSFFKPRDKTFGLKNKKGAKNQKFIAQVHQQVKQGGTATARKLEEQKRIEKEQKEAELKKQKEIAGLFKPVQPVQKVEKGADPKSVLCAFFKQGMQKLSFSFIYFSCCVV